MQYVNPMALSNAICDAYDIKNTIAFLDLNNQPKDNNGTEFTIGECIQDILLFLNELETTLPHKERE